MSRAAACLRILLRLLPAALAVALPFLTPGIREGGPFVPAAWIQAEPAHWAAQSLWIETWARPEGSLPQKGDAIAVGDLQSRKRHVLERRLYLQGRLSLDTGTFQVVDLRWQETGRWLAFGIQLVVGMVLLVALPPLLFRRARRETLELRPWTL